ncbi:P-loop containing nucleoside triphosphate hydrolase protein [Hysterangium stoloniferum]|nr:P-loop containing nucleoside triphosphate hydrolase protein [Hysterangium stoloniferum]
MPPRICPNILSQGVCIDASCGFEHDVHPCNTCRIICTDPKALEVHLSGKRHSKRVRSLNCPHPSFCKICDVSLSSPWTYPQHIQGRNHLALLAEKQNNPTTDDGESTDPDVPVVPLGHVRCDICDISLSSRFWSAHRTGINHRKKERFATLQAALEEAEKDKHGVELTAEGEDGLDFGLIESDSQSSKSINVKVLLTTPEKIDITEIRFSSAKSLRRRRTSFGLSKINLPLRIQFQISMEFSVVFDHRGLYGRFNDRLEIVFFVPSLQGHFVITRAISARVGSKADWELIKPSAPYEPKKRKNQEPENEIVRGIKPPQIAGIRWVVALPLADIPKNLESLFSGTKRVPLVVADVRATWLPHVLDETTYGRHFSVLLHVEEVQMNIDIQRYDDEDVPMDPVPGLPFYRLPVPGLAEKRPSIIVGDRILFQNKSSATTGKWFEGFVHRVRLSDVDLKLHTSFNNYKGQKYNVRFKLGRLPLRRMHQALGTAFSSKRVLFPTDTDIRRRTPPSYSQRNDIRAVNRHIMTNPPQLLAVATILNMPEGSVPFVLFGPPGTGKTVTVVEAMRQILLNNPHSRILACAPSNSAADLIAERLGETFMPSQLFRLNAPSRSKEAMPTRLDRFAKTNENGTFSIPSLEELRKFPVIVSTCISASVPYGIGMERGHFSHIFIDEAGQACEPEAMIPIKTMADTKTNIILSGDPKQLGPIVRSSVALELGLGKSYLDRLMTLPMYDPSIGNGISVVKLIKNWRSHVEILKYPNEQFYKGELEAHGDKVITHSLLQCSELATPGFPIVFHAIKGKDLREGNSPSFFNADEASLVKRYVEDIRGNQKLRLQDANIGVITPYHAQVMKIRTLLRKKYSGIKVGSVEEFQGQERRVIIISTVRSSIDFVEFDIRHTLGFVANARRFNVAMTRAQALLIVIGDPDVLSLDPLWRGFLNHVYLGGGWKGVAPDWDPDEPILPEGGYDSIRREAALTDMELLVERIRTLIVESTEPLDAHDEDDAHVDRPWREAD